MAKPRKPAAKPAKPVKRPPRRLKPNPKQKQRQPERHRTDEEVANAIRSTKGNIHAACRALGLRSAFKLRQRINSKPELKEALEDAREELLSLAETSLEALIIAGDYRAVNNVLVNHGRHAGWRDEKTLKVEQIQNIEVEVTWEDGSPDVDEAGE